MMPRPLAALWLAALPLLAGCGFTPLYARPGLGGDLAAIQVVAPQGRVGYLLREDLDDDLGRDKGAAPRFRLEMTEVQTRDPRGLTLEDVAERYVLGLTVSYRLVDMRTGAVAHAGKVVSQVGYDAVIAPYAGIAGRQDAQDRAALDAARKIQLDLAAWTARRTPAPAP